MQNNYVSWEFIAGIAAIVSTLCVAFARDPLPIHTSKPSSRGRWLLISFLLISAASLVALIMLYKAWIFWLDSLDTMPLINFSFLLLQSMFTAYLIVSARVIFEIKEISY